MSVKRCIINKLRYCFLYTLSLILSHQFLKRDVFYKVNQKLINLTQKAKKKSSSIKSEFRHDHRIPSTSYDL